MTRVTYECIDIVQGLEICWYAEWITQTSRVVIHEMASKFLQIFERIMSPAPNKQNVSLTEWFPTFMNY